jgi:hypothetical protein
MLEVGDAGVEAAQQAIANLDVDRMRQLIQGGPRKGDELWQEPFKLGPVSSMRTNGTLHAAVLARFFTATSHALGGTPPEEVLVEVNGAAALCRLMLEHGLPVYSASPDKARKPLGDDFTLTAQLFVSRIWSPVIHAPIAALFRDYVKHGVIELNVPLCEDLATIGGRLPVDAAIKLGNGPAAATCIRAGCDMRGVATGTLGEPIDLVEYVRRTATFNAAQTVAQVVEAMMERSIGAAVRQAPAPLTAPPIRRQASV